jgi:hypothetical protein
VAFKLDTFNLASSQARRPIEAPTNPVGMRGKMTLKLLVSYHAVVPTRASARTSAMPHCGCTLLVFTTRMQKQELKSIEAKAEDDISTGRASFLGYAIDLTPGLGVQIMGFLEPGMLLARRYISMHHFCGVVAMQAVKSLQTNLMGRL